jgi:hypothetical protein
MSTHRDQPHLIKMIDSNAARAHPKDQPVGTDIDDKDDTDEACSLRNQPAEELVKGD